MARILLLGDVNSPHLIKWSKVLHEGMHHIGIFSLSKAKDNWFKDLNIKLLFDSNFEQNTFKSSYIKKIRYIQKILTLKKVIHEFKPDFLHAHYASSYGLLGALSKFHPYFISAWGSDILVFPSNPITKHIIRYNYSKADKIIVPSKILKEKSSLYTQKNISIIPFGIDTDLFKPINKKNSDKFIIGTVKSLEKIYGIDLLIKAFYIVKKKLPDKDIELHIVGSGSEENNLKNLVTTLNIFNSVKFLKNISHSELPKIYNQFDVAVFLSRSESFGVSVLESSACEVPVIVSAVGGLLEVVDDSITGFYTEIENSEQAADKILLLLNDENLRKQLGKNGRKKVIREYNLKDIKETILSLYK